MLFSLASIASSLAQLPDHRLFASLPSFCFLAYPVACLCLKINPRVILLHVYIRII